MNLYLALPLVALAVNGVLAVVALRGGWQAAGRRPFALFLAGMASWGGLLYLMRSSTSLDEARWWDELVVMNFAFIMRFRPMLPLPFTCTTKSVPLARAVPMQGNGCRVNIA